MNHTAAVIMFAMTSVAASAAIVVNPEVAYPVPQIPHGLDWSILFVPEPRIERETLSEEDLRHILPPVVAMARTEGSFIVGSTLPSGRSPVSSLIAIFTLTILLFTGYGLIPHIHSQVLRFRSINLNRDLFT